MVLMVALEGRAERNIKHRNSSSVDCDYSKDCSSLCGYLVRNQRVGQSTAWPEGGPIIIRNHPAGSHDYCHQILWKSGL